MSHSTHQPIRTQPAHPTRWFVRPDQTEDGSGLLYIDSELWAFGYDVCDDAVTGCWLERISDSRYVTVSFANGDIRCSDSEMRAAVCRALVELR